jgi:hypothetical protein
MATDSFPYVKLKYLLQVKRFSRGDQKLHPWGALEDIEHELLATALAPTAVKRGAAPLESLCAAQDQARRPWHNTPDEPLTMP